MKINDKALAQYASAPEGIDKNGYLRKKGEVNQKERKRWFVLKGNLLFYFDKRGDKQPLGMIVLENCSVEVTDSEHHSFCVRFQALGTAKASRTYILYAESESEMESWMKAITSASFCYAKEVVNQFEKTVKTLQSSSEHKEVAEQGMVKETLFSQVEHRTNLNRTSYDVTDSVQHMGKSNSINVDVKCTIAPPLGMYTVTSVNNAKTKFKTLNTVRKSKSSDSLDKIKSKSPNPKRKSKVNTLRRPNYTTTFTADETVVAYELEKTTFEILHTSFGAAIFTKIGETL